LLEHSLEILRRLHAAEVDFGRFVNGLTAVLRIGAYQAAAAHLLPETIHRFGASHPDVQIELTHATGDFELLRHLEAGELDLTYATAPLPEGPFEATALLRDEYVVVVRRNGSPSIVAPPTLAELSQLPLIVFRSCRHIRAIEEALQAGGVRLNVVLRSDDNATVRELVAAGEGIGLMPRMAYEDDQRLRTVQAPAEIPPRTALIVGDSERIPSGAASLDAARAAAASFRPA
jgi:DNA-binding transcriptional LysR family regulator